MNIKKRISYKFDQYLSKGTVSLIMLLLIVIIIFILVMITIGYLVNPEKEFLEYFWIGINQTLDPGNLLGEDGSFIYMLIMTISTLLGIFVMSLFISFILNGFQNKLLELSNGKSVVLEKNHTLILGWSDGIYVIIAELLLANLNQKNPKIVILSHLKPLEMSEMMKMYIPDTKNTKLIFRSGDIANKDDLLMCSIEESRSVIVLGSDFEITRSLIGISATNFYDLQGSHVSAVFENSKNVDACINIAKGKLEALYFNDFLKRIVAQTSLQPGLSMVFNDLFDFDGDEIYFYENESLVGLNFLDVQKGFKKSIAIGFKRGDEIVIHPMNTETIQINDKIIVISEDDDAANFILTKNELNEASIKKTERLSNLQKCQLLIIGYNENTFGVLEELDNYILEGSECTLLVVNKDMKEEISNNKDRLNNMKLSVLTGDTSSRKFLETVLNDSYKSILIFGNKSTPTDNRDSESLLSLLHLRDLENDLNLSFNIVVEINNIKNAKIVDLVKVDDFVISEMTSNKLLTQISENRDLRYIFEYLLQDEGSEIYLKPIEAYVALDTDVSFYDLIDACNLKNEIPLGYKIASAAENNGIFLNPLKTNMVKFKKNDYIIVLSED